MNFISKVVIDGFWETHSFQFDLNEDVNFLIGINGSGKTTVINLIVAVLKADFSVLDKIEFDSVTITLKESGGRKKPEVSVIKKEIKSSPFRAIEYKIKNSSSEKPEVYSLDDYEERISYRNIPRHILNREIQRRYGDSIIEHLNQLSDVSWLSVHRSSPTEDRERKSFESTVDRKLDELSNRLVRYFSTLGRQGSALLEKFQETIFLSMLTGKNPKGLFHQDTELDIEEEKKALNAIFSQFNLDAKKYTSRVDNHFRTLKKATEKLSKTEALGNVDVAAIVLNDRIDHIIEDWNVLVKQREKIFKPRETFLQIINNLMERKKTFSINDRNELNATTKSGKELPMKLLSSGEKQLLIILGEALLQQKRSCIYIADEPELSLHVKWQESLVDNLLALNPKAQIIFATHSPDVVSRFGNKVFDMENLL